MKQRLHRVSLVCLTAAAGYWLVPLFASSLTRLVAVKPRVRARGIVRMVCWLPRGPGVSVSPSGEFCFCTRSNQPHTYCQYSTAYSLSSFMMRIVIVERATKIRTGIRRRDFLASTARLYRYPLFKYTLSHYHPGDRITHPLRLTSAEPGFSQARGADTTKQMAVERHYNNEVISMEASLAVRTFPILEKKNSVKNRFEGVCYLSPG